jgi:hypothetical protein
LPLLLAFLLGEIWQMAQKLSFSLNKRIVDSVIVSIMIFILVFNLMLFYQRAITNHATGYPYPWVLEDPVSWSSYEAIFNWINHYTQVDDILASGLDTMMYLYTNRCSFRPFAMNPLALFYASGSCPMTMKNLIGILKAYQPKYLIQTPMPIFSEDKPFGELLREMIAKYPGWLTPVYVGEDKRFLIYELQLNLQPAGID